MKPDDFLNREKKMAARSYCGNELKYLKEVLESGNLSCIAGGKFTGRFEEAFAKAVGSRYAVALNSCMSALHAAVIAAGAGSGSEVICDSLFVFGAMAVLYNNAIPIFVDIDPVTHNMNPDLIEPAITERTKAIIVTHAWGLPAEMDRIVEIAGRHRLMVIEDCAESVLATYKGRCTGTWGDVGCFSFQASKQLSLGDGGMATMNDEEIWRKIANQAGAPTFLSVAHSLDFNYRMTEPIAAIGLAQLETLPETIKKLERNAGYYDKAVEGCKWLKLQRCEHATHTFYHWVATFWGDRYGISFDDFKNAVKQAGIGSITVGYTKMPAYRHPLFINHLAHAFHCNDNKSSTDRYPDGLCPAAENVIPRIVMAYPMESEETAKKEAEKLARVIRILEHT
jgi:dTDP-4-amino-4,6-dideoxygalactose transaminase